jgi:Na+/melibiose symporter-like transporter
LTMLGISLVGLCQLILVPLKVLGLLPDSLVIPAVIAATVLANVGLTVSYVGFQSMMADAADHHEQLSGARREGLCFSGITLALMCSGSIGSMIAGFALDAVGFPHGLGKNGVALTIPAGALRDVGLIYGPGAGLLSLCALLILLRYRLGRTEYAALRDALQAPRPLSNLVRGSTNST